MLYESKPHILINDLDTTKNKKNKCVIELIKQCLTKNPVERSSFEKIYEKFKSFEVKC